MIQKVTITSAGEPLVHCSSELVGLIKKRTQVFSTDPLVCALTEYRWSEERVLRVVGRLVIAYKFRLDLVEPERSLALTGPLRPETFGDGLGAKPRNDKRRRRVSIVS